MTVEVKMWSEAPAGTYNPFAKDDRCYAVHYVVADHASQVLLTIEDLLTEDWTLVDYDINQDTTIEKWVGVTCRDRV